MTMKTTLDRIKKLADNFAVLLEQERRACHAQLDALIDALQAVQGNTADRRLQRIALELKSLKERLALLSDMGCSDFLTKIAGETEALATELADARAARVLLALAGTRPHSLNAFCERLLDLLNEATGAERGFVLFYLPESTEADCVAARNFQTRDLSLDEYSFSRTLLRDLFARGQAILLEDASQNATYSNETSVIRYRLKSVLAAPLTHEGRAIGAIYLENNSRPYAFNPSDPPLLDSVAAFAVHCLAQARLLPVAFERRGSVFLDESKAAKEIVGHDPKILALQEMIRRLADSQAPVLIEGESGTGKELVARALHYQSARRDHPFVAINCAAIPDALLESELFGHEKGAFTGATERYAGRIERSAGGTLFLDEVSELAYPLQAKLLRFLQSHELDRLGGKETLHVDARVIAATSRDLKAMVAEGKFQSALYYRLNVIPLHAPALRDRPHDIPLLADYFVKKFCDIYHKQLGVEREVYDGLREHCFPGNVRELENLVHRLVALAETDRIRVGDLPPEFLPLRSQRVSLEREPLHLALQRAPEDLAELRRRRREISRLLAEQERHFAERAVEQAGGNLTEAAARLGVHRITLHRMLRRSKAAKP
jgi:transcriptional regulator with GAF, ATPase, and Fis domain